MDQTAPDMTVKLERARSTEALRQARLAREDETKRYRSKLHPGLRHAANAYKDLSGKKLQVAEERFTERLGVCRPLSGWFRGFWGD